MDAQTLIQGQYPVAIATSLALEGLAGIYPDRPQSPPPVLKYTDVVISCRTLIRNILEAVDGEMNRSKLEECKHQLIGELMGIPRILSDMSGGMIQTHFYFCTLKNMQRKYKYANFYAATTDRQKAMLKNTNIMIDFLKENKDQYQIIWVDETIPVKTNRTLLLTHQPVDILHITGTSSLSLIESHTGVIKQSSHFYTKLKDGKKLDNIPFDRMTIQMFGDSGGMFMPRPIKFRNRMLQYADEKHWNPSWTKGMILLSMNDRKEPLLLLDVKQLYG